MSSRCDLNIDWCSYEAAKYAVEHWHYSRKMPAGKLAKFGVWEDGKYVGAVIFGTGANRNIVNAYGVLPIEGCELVRVALRRHDARVSRILSICIRLLKKEYRGLRLIVSYADPAHGHHGGIYQAMGWVYDGISDRSRDYFLDGKAIHHRMFTEKFTEGTKSKNILKVTGPGKYRYLFALDSSMKEQIIRLAKPYPKRAKQAMAVPTEQRRGSADLHAPTTGQTS